METCTHLPYTPKRGQILPFSLPPNCNHFSDSKTMETIITKQLFAFLEANSLLSDHQYRFQKARSSGDLLAYAVHAWSSALESCGESRVISLDISKAFEHVWHKGLFAKLPIFSLHPTHITWIASFLSGRSVAIRVDGFLSRPHPINSFVPQDICNLSCSIHPLHK